MTYTGTHEPLFIQRTNPHDLFEKTASIARMPDDERYWSSAVFKYIYRELPYLSGFDISLNLEKVEPEAGFAHGHALVRSKKAVVAGGNGSAMVKIPIIISDRQLQPFYTMMVGNVVKPLSQEGLEAEMASHSMFAGAKPFPKTQKNLVDDTYPPYQQRQGFGMMYGNNEVSGMGKLAAIEDMQAGQVSAKDLRTLASLKAHEKTDEAMRDLTLRDRAHMAKVPAAIGATVGAGLGMYRNYKTQGKSIMGGGLRGAAAGLGVAGTGLLTTEVMRRQRDAQRRSGLYQDPYNQMQKMAGMSETGQEFIQSRFVPHPYGETNTHKRLRAHFSKRASEMDAPAYSAQGGSMEQSCGNCKHYQRNSSMMGGAGYCALFDFQPSSQGLCSKWANADSDRQEDADVLDKNASFWRY